MGNKSCSLFPSYGEDFGGKDRGKKRQLRKITVLHGCSISCLGSVEWGCLGGDRLSALSLSTTLAGSAEGWGGVSGLMVWTKGPVHTRMLSVTSKDGGSPLGAQLSPLGSFLSEASCPLSEGALGEGGHL